MMSRNRNKRSLFSLGLVVLMAAIFSMAIIPSEVIADGGGGGIGTPPSVSGDSIPLDTTGGTSSTGEASLDDGLITVTVELILTINEILN